MEKDEVNKIIQDEGLTNFNLFEKYSVKENEVVIKKENKSWEVFSTSEKGSAEGIKVFQNESEALDNFTERLRAKNKVLEYFRKKGL